MPLTVYWVHSRSDLKYSKNEVSSLDNSCKNLERMRVSLPVNSVFSDRLWSKNNSWRSRDRQVLNLKLHTAEKHDEFVVDSHEEKHVFIPRVHSA